MSVENLVKEEGKRILKNLMGDDRRMMEAYIQQEAQRLKKRTDYVWTSLTAIVVVGICAGLIHFLFYVTIESGYVEENRQLQERCLEQVICDCEVKSE